MAARVEVQRLGPDWQDFVAKKVRFKMCTSFVITAEDGSPIYGRTMEWGGFDLKSDLVLVPRNTPFTSALAGGKKGLAWRSQIGFIAINAVDLPVATDGMNESGLTVGVLYFPGFAQYQPMVDAAESSSLNNVDLAGYLLGNLRSVAEARVALPRIRVVYNADLDKSFGAPVPLHWVLIDSAGDSLVVEYVGGELKMYDNKVGVMTNAPGYDWHLLNLRNYPNLQAQEMPHNAEINGVSLAPFGVGSGMRGLPGDFTPPSRFIRAVAFTHTTLPFADADAGVREATRILHNFDIPRGLVREGEHAGSVIAGYTQWSVVGDIRNRRYYYWTERNRRMRLVDLSKLDFGGSKIIAVPLDEVPGEDVKDRTADFLA